MSVAVLETVGWTGALIALVLLLRRPVARAFGPLHEDPIGAAIGAIRQGKGQDAVPHALGMGGIR